MNNFFVDISQIHNGGSVEILGSDVNHIGQVLRMKSGEQIMVRDGYGYEYLCEITKISQEQVLAKILEMREIAAELPSEVWLFQSLPKGDKMELIVQKAVELGVSKIVPVASQRCVVKLDKKRESSKIKRWNFIAESAAKQSGRGVIPEVLPVARFSQALSIAEELDIKLMPYECADELLKERNKTPMQQT
ncbi:MAG: 16S rRNA (uracil(1498)-N(3))-methyltransferase, partial [Lachnospiraceae bacterium]|nr:16S rRNA (uracil(1498)-N(3))-methyltransferase [Lachnospiraceae bacterium]